MIEISKVPDSAKLYVTKVDFGSGDVRQIVTGLQPYIPEDRLLNHMLVAVTNLKAAKLAKLDSQAMILTAEQEVGGQLQVALLVPPPGSEPGDVVFVEGMSPAPTAPKVMSGNLWKQIPDHLVVQGTPPCCVCGVSGWVGLGWQEPCPRLVWLRCASEWQGLVASGREARRLCG